MWVAGSALAAILLATTLLIAVVLFNGLGVFWPAAIVQLQLDDGSRVIGQWMRTETNPDTGEESIQLKTGNRELDPQRMDFHWYRKETIREMTWPPDVVVVERMENGNCHGLLETVKAPSLAMSAAEGIEEGLAEALVLVRRREAAEIHPLATQLAALSHRLQHVGTALMKLEYRQKKTLANVDDSDREPRREIDDRIAELRAEESQIRSASDELVTKKATLEADIRQNVASFRVASGETHDVALADIVRVYYPNAMHGLAKARHYLSKVWELLWADPRESNTEGGLFPAIFGTVVLVFLMAIACFPLGVLAGVYLGEYARQGALVRLVRIAVHNLAGIPSIVYGIFGLGFFVHGLGGLIDGWFFPERVEAGIPTYGTGGILWASLTLGLLTVPVVIVATEEAMRTIPRSFREGSYALGATKFQTLLRVLLPMASPGIMTGFILATARAAGEVAPLMITGVAKLAPSLPLDGYFPFFHPDRKFMHLGFHIYDIGFQSPNVEATKPMVYVTTFLLVLIVLLMSSLAIYLRNHMRRRYQSHAL